MKLLGGVVEDKDKMGAINFLNVLEEVLHARAGERPFDHDEIRLFEDIRMCRSYLNDRAPSVKMLLEYIALITPTRG